MLKRPLLWGVDQLQTRFRAWKDPIRPHIKGIADETGIRQMPGKRLLISKTDLLESGGILARPRIIRTTTEHEAKKKPQPVSKQVELCLLVEAT